MSAGWVFGLLKLLIRELQDAATIELQLFVSGSHLMQSHGLTVREIEEEGFHIASQVAIWSGDDSPIGVAADTGGVIASYVREPEMLATELASRQEFDVMYDRHEQNYTVYLRLGKCISKFKRLAALSKCLLAHCHQFGFCSSSARSSFCLPGTSCITTTRGSRSTNADHRSPE